MDQAGIIDSDDSNIEQARGCESTGIVKTGMMERTERQVVSTEEMRTWAISVRSMMAWSSSSISTCSSVALLPS